MVGGRRVVRACLRGVTYAAIGTALVFAASACPDPAPAPAPTVAPASDSAAAIAVPADVLAKAGLTDGVPPCATEDSDDCYWDAPTMGNGHGRSFVVIDGHYFFGR